jgi:ubiquinone/menaquinone biosynthesis C-methylase UbiE
MTSQYDAIGGDFEHLKSLPLSRFVEQPTVSAMMTDLSGRRVLDLGCGSGRYTVGRSIPL